MAIDPLKFNYIRYGQLQRENQGEEAAAEKQQVTQNANPTSPAHVSEEAVYEYLNQLGSFQANQIRTVDVSKYVSEESAQRIAESMRSFEKSIGKSIEAVNEEFPNLDDSAKMSLALKMFDEKNF